MNKNIQGKKVSNKRFRNLVKFVALSAVLIFGMGANYCTRPCENPPCDVLTATKVYLLAFKEAASDRIRVRWSEDGQTWSSSSSFPNETTSVGIGSTSSADGLLNLVLWADSSNKIQAVWGLGTDVWDTRPTGPSLDQDVLSAPMPAYAGENIYLVAFRTTGDIVTVQALNSSTRKWLSTSLAPAHSNNSNVSGRPDIAILNGKVVLAWHRSDNTVGVARGDLQIATVGGVKTPIINWTNNNTHQFTESGFGVPVSDLAITHDGSTFYLGFDRKTLGGPLQAEWLFVYPSNDGITWGTPIKLGQVPLYSVMNISARSDGSLLAAFINSSTTKRRLYKYSGGSWTEIMKANSSSSDSVFYWVPAWNNFALNANKP
jgi:hypothetical protein